MPTTFDAAPPSHFAAGTQIVGLATELVMPTVTFDAAPPSHFAAGTQIFIPVDPRPASGQASSTSTAPKQEGRMRPGKSFTARYAYLKCRHLQ